MADTVDTASVQDRRPLRFEDIDQLMADADRLVADDRACSLHRLGNWTLGQTLGHIAAWASFPYEGYPSGFRLPFFVKWIARLGKNAFIRRPMRPGMRIPRIAGGTLATDLLSTDEGIKRFRSAFQRLAREAPSRPNPVFGPLTHEEWIALNLRHAELHLSFFRPGSSRGANLMDVSIHPVD